MPTRDAGLAPVAAALKGSSHAGAPGEIPDPNRLAPLCSARARDRERLSRQLEVSAQVASTWSRRCVGRDNLSAHKTSAVLKTIRGVAQERYLCPSIHLVAPNRESMAKMTVIMRRLDTLTREAFQRSDSSSNRRS